MRVVTYVEIEAFVVDNLLQGMEAGILAPAPIWTDLKTFDPRPFRGKIHGITGGYPCQPFSVAGKRKGTADPRHLWPYIHRTIDAIRPLWCWFENVSAHLNMGFDEVYKSLSGMGYTVEAGIFTAEEVGAPHQRERLFILAVANPFSAEWGKDIAEGYRNNRRYSLSQRSQSAVGFGECRSELADTDSDGQRRNPKILTDQGKKIEGETQREERDHLLGQRSWPNVGDSGTDVGHTPGVPERKPANKINAIARGRKARDKSSGSGSGEMANPGNKRFQGGKQHRASDEGIGRAESAGSIIQCGEIVGNAKGINQWGKWDQSRESQFQVGGSGDRWPAGPGQPQYAWESPRTIKSGVGCRINGYNYREDFLRSLGNSVVEQESEEAFVTLVRKLFMQCQ